LGPLGTAATNRTIAPAPGDYNNGKIGGMMFGRGNLIKLVGRYIAVDARIILKC
jgi:hypothetical protein